MASAKNIAYTILIGPEFTDFVVISSAALTAKTKRRHQKIEQLV